VELVVYSIHHIIYMTSYQSMEPVMTATYEIRNVCRTLHL